ncbi:ion transporter [Verrucomicrobiales bacterium]|nr:ion transporter [Verrucomicrobiales bacterium]
MNKQIPINKSRCQALVASPLFNRFIIGVILLAGALVGIETHEPTAVKYHGLLQILDWGVLLIFILEIIIKVIALAPRPQDFFKDPWNVFDFVIVAVCLIPASGGFGPVLRLFRLLRVLRLLSAVPKLQLLVSALLKSLPSMLYVSVLLLLLFYVYAVAGVMFFADNDPVHFGHLGDALLSLFRIVTLEDWTDVMYLQIYGSDVYEGYNISEANLAANYPEFKPQAQPILATIYFVSFVLLGTMVMLNLVIGVIVNGMDDARVEAEIESIKKAEAALDGTSVVLDLPNQVATLSNKIRELNAAMARLSKTVSIDSPSKK